MAQTGTNYTAKWELVDGTLTISPVSGNSGAMRTTKNMNLFGTILRRDPNDDSKGYVTLTENEMLSVDKIIFVGDISFFTWSIVISGDYSYVRQPRFMNFFSGFSNLTYIDLRGLNTSSATSFSFFLNIPSLTTIVGLDELDTSGCDDYGSMFKGSKVQELDVSTFENMNTAGIAGMFYNLRYCTTITLPSYFHRDDITYGIGIVPNGGTITNQQGVTIASDEDFFAFSDQYGEWTRNIRGSTDLYFRVKKVSRDGINVTITYSYATTSTTNVEVYIKESDQSSYPTTPIKTTQLNIGSGESSISFDVTSDNSYDVQIITTDGTTTIYSFPSIDSNILLLEIDDQGNLESYGDITAGGDITDGSGNLLANMPYVDTKANMTFAKVTQALADGKSVFMFDGEYMYVYSSHDTTNDYYWFSMVYAHSGFQRWRLDSSDVWTDEGVTNFADYVIAQGTSGIWRYRKWNSGVYECFGTQTASIAVTTASAGYGGYRSGKLSIPAFPITFAATPTVTATVGSGSQGAWVSNVQPTTTGGGYYLSSGASLSAANRSIQFQVMGRWK